MPIWSFRFFWIVLVLFPTTSPISLKSIIQVPFYFDWTTNPHHTILFVHNLLISIYPHYKYSTSITQSAFLGAVIGTTWTFFFQRKQRLKDMLTRGTIEAHLKE